MGPGGLSGKKYYHLCDMGGLSGKKYHHLCDLGGLSGKKYHHLCDPRGAIWEKCLHFICPGRALVEYIPANRPQNQASRYHIIGRRRVSRTQLSVTALLRPSRFLRTAPNTGPFTIILLVEEGLAGLMFRVTALLRC